MGADDLQIREVHKTWIDAVNAGDLARLLTLIADDVVLLNTWQAPFGRAEFSANFSDAHRKLRINCVSDLEEVVVVGDVAFTRSRDTLSVTSRDSGEETQFAGYRMTVYRKQSDGRWLLARDAHTLTPVEKRTVMNEPTTPPQPTHVANVAKVGVGFGTALAIAISWSANKSILWAVFHGLLSWVYVVYYAMKSTAP